MADTALSARPRRVSPVRASGLSPRDVAPAWAGLVVVAALAWFVTILQAREMGIGVGVMGMALPLFLAMWVAMMAAMMFPSVAPIAILWVRAITKRAGSTGSQHAVRISMFVLGYLTAWAGYGLVAFAALLGTGRLVDASPGAAKWLGVGLFTAAGIYQFTPLKDVCLRHCRSPFMQFLHYANFKGRLRDLRVGLHHGAYCVGCCWGLMVVLIAVGVMNVPAMAGLATVIFVEKVWSHGELLERVVGVAFVALAVVAVFYPGIMPGLRASDIRMAVGM